MRAVVGVVKILVGAAILSVLTVAMMRYMPNPWAILHPTGVSSPPPYASSAVASPAPPPQLSPQRPPCANPNVPATATNPVAPTLPAEVQQRGITGSVEVEVDLNADSKITTVSIHKSSDPALNAPALMAARASTFKTQVVNCRPVAASYLYIVEFPPH